MCNIALTSIDLSIVEYLKSIWQRDLPSKIHLLEGKSIDHSFFFNKHFRARGEINYHIDELKNDTGGINITELNKYFIAYTRYADDITISTNNKDLIYEIKNIFPHLVAANGYNINPKKTRIQKFSFGNRAITGVSISNDKIKPTRAVLKKLRASRHQKNLFNIRGLEEWCKLKLPKRV